MDTKELERALTEVRAPTHSGGFALAPAGRVRALHFRLLLEANRQRGQARHLETLLRALLEKADAGDGCPFCQCSGALLAEKTHARDCALRGSLFPLVADEPAIPQLSLEESLTTEGV